MTTVNKNFRVKNGLDVQGPIGVGSDPSYGTSGQILVSGGSGVAPSWQDPSAGGGGISNVVEDTTPQLGGDLDAQSYDITTVNAITLDTTPTGVPIDAGTLSWDPDNETLQVKLDADVNLQVGQEHVIRVKNNSGSIGIPDRTLVMFAGATGDTIKVTPAITDDVNVYPSDYIVGITTEAIPADGFGFVTQFGFINQVNTADWAVGTLLYPDPTTPGGFVSSKPAAPAWQTPIAAVTKQNESSGRIFVRAIPGIQLNSVENIELTSVAGDDILAYNGTSELWENRTFAELDLLTATDAASTYQPVDADLTAIAALGGTSGYLKKTAADTWSLVNSNFIIANGTNNIYYQTSQPSSPSAGDIWIDSDSTGAELYSFKTIEITGSNTILADVVADTLTVTAGRNIIVSGNATTDTLTIESKTTPDAPVIGDTAKGFGYIGMPQNAPSISGTYTYTFQLSDAGKHFYATGTPSSATLTIPANGTTAFEIGTTIVVINDFGAATNLSIAITTDTLQLAGTGTTGTRTLARYGMATLVKVTSTKWVISGNGLT